MQFVKVDLQARRAYTYAWNGESLKPGDKVRVPGNAVNDQGGIGRVIREVPGDSIGWDGMTLETLVQLDQVKFLNGLARRAQPVEPDHSDVL